MPRKRSAQNRSRTSAAARQLGRLMSEALDEAGQRAAHLSWGERLDILDAWVQVIDGAYAHLPLKRALYGFDPIRAIEHLRSEVTSLTDLQFHRELIRLINRLRDAHTQYSGPQSLAGAVATLPFLVESWGPADDCHYVVTKVSDRGLMKDRHFEPGVTLTYWNGVPFARAVELHAETETGGRPDARQARALDSLTFRSIEYGPPPDEHWVNVGYTDLRKVEREVRVDWRIVWPERAPLASRAPMARLRRGIDPGAEAARRARKLMFNAGLWRKERSPAAAKSLAVQYEDFLSAREVMGGKYGYLRIWSFDVDDDDGFLAAAIQLLGKLPNRGLIIDLRDNPGGFIWAAERMLQLFTPERITPTKFALRATPLTSAMAAAPFNQTELGPWADSLAGAPSTGEPYSNPLPMTTVEQCNDIGQRYGGPVVVVVNANTYSSGDLFTAGVVDNRIGPVVCIGQATGAGGANVWTSADLNVAMKAAGLPLPRLAQGTNFTLSLRRAVRSGDADGVLIEDTGVTGLPYAMTRRDVFERNKDLIAYCGKILEAQPWTEMEVRRRRDTLTVRTSGLDHLDIYADGHPAGPGQAVKKDGLTRVSLPAGAAQVEVVGFSGNVVRQRRRLVKT